MRIYNVAPKDPTLGGAVIDGENRFILFPYTESCFTFHEYESLQIRNWYHYGVTKTFCGKLKALIAAAKYIWKI